MILAALLLQGSLGTFLAYLVILAALWMIFVKVVAPQLPAVAVTVINIVVGAIACLIAINVLMSFAPA